MIIDIIIVILLGLGLYRGFKKGAVKTILSFLAWLGGLILATALASSFAPSFAHISDDILVQKAIAFFVIVVVVVGIGHVVVWIAQKTLKALYLGLFDKLIGGGIGMAKELLKVLILLSVFSPILAKTQSFQESTLAQMILPFAPVAKVIAQEIWQEVKEESHHHF
ncbi:CvpA family protein [Moraxella oblonga]|uniref:CvpA family protein n=1 Tax=Moraxella oblonga TaxID=200413 RepID=UPI0008311576|nr:CvpA family protein [Moraxella oblonga]